VYAVTRSFLHECPTAVWVVKKAPHALPARVLAAVAPESATPTPLDRKILRAAVAAAEVLGAELRVVHAWQPLDEAVEWLPTGVRLRADKARAMEEARARHARWFTDLVAAELSHHPSERTHLVEGVPGEAVLEAAEKTGADLIVFGTARTPDHPGMYVGSTAETIIERTPVSILAIKPDGFVSPVSQEHTGS
jgi:nucleotide-binding universal stress UspA family protein